MSDQLPENLKQAIKKYLAGEANLQETELVNTWYRSFDDSHVEVDTALPDLHYKIDKSLRSRLAIPQSADTAHSDSRRFDKKLLFKIAASLFIIFSAGFYIFNTRNEEGSLAQQLQSIPVTADVAPGADKASLVLSNGFSIALERIKVGDTIFQGQVFITKTSAGKVAYHTNDKNKQSGKIAYNTISTPRGGKYQISLPDGSLVWLNAESSITYPLVFPDKGRKVELIGEAYFEVAHNKKSPFSVVTEHQTIEVLGTHFNINSYENEKVTKTTLISGSVKVIPKASTATQLLAPGHAAQVNLDGTVHMAKVNTLEAISWKNGDFLFEDASLVNILHQLERWYDVDVDYNHIPKTHYNGSISRNVKLSQVLQMLEVTGSVKFKIDGKSLKIKK